MPLDDWRGPGFPDVARGLFADMKRVFKTERGQVLIFPGSGTGGWEAAITDTLSPGDKVLAARFGQFSHLWIDLRQRHKLGVFEAEPQAGPRSWRWRTWSRCRTWAAPPSKPGSPWA